MAGLSEGMIGTSGAFGTNANYKENVWILYRDLILAFLYPTNNRMIIYAVWVAHRAKPSAGWHTKDALV